MRIRTIKPEFWSHPVISRLTDEARLVAIGLLNVADDEGFFLASPALVRSALYPFDEDSTRIRRVLAALSRIGYIEVREHPEQGEIGFVVNFKKHQRIDRPTKSKLKPYYDSSNARRTLDDDSLLEQGKEQGTGKGKEQGTAPADADASGLPFPELPEGQDITPPALQTPEFKTAWDDWLAYRRKRKLSTYKPQSIRAQLCTLAEWGHDAAIASIRESIRQQWQGLFPPKGGNHNSGPLMR